MIKTADHYTLISLKPIASIVAIIDTLGRFRSSFSRIALANCKKRENDSSSFTFHEQIKPFCGDLKLNDIILSDLLK